MELGGARGRVESPPVGDAFEFVLAAVVVDDAGSGGKVLDCLGDEHLGRLCECAHAGADGDGDAGDVVAVEFDLTGVQAGSYLDSEPPTPPQR